MGASVLPRFVRCLNGRTGTWTRPRPSASSCWCPRDTRQGDYVVCSMSAAHPLLFLGLFWILVHALHRRHTGSSSNHPNTLLPVTTLNHHDRHKTPSMRISLSRLSLRAEYFGLNRAHDRFSSMVASSPHSVTSRILVLFYDLGSLLAVSGMLLAVFFLASTTAKFCYSATLAFSTSGEPQSSPVHTKRDLDIRAEVSNDVSVSSFDTQDTYIQLLVSSPFCSCDHLYQRRSEFV